MRLKVKKQMHGKKSRISLCFILSETEYDKALSLQHRIVSAKYKKRKMPDVILVLEHKPVFTLGKRGVIDNLLVPEDLLKRKNIRIIRAERGGDITYHGPGQVVVYPVIDLYAAGIKVRDFVLGLEDVMIRTVKDWGIKAVRNMKNRGIWIDGRKLGSIGIRVRHGISFHGLALNVNLSLESFGWINPCGLADVEMTSMEKELDSKVSMAHVKRMICCHFSDVFEMDLILKSAI